MSSDKNTNKLTVTEVEPGIYRATSPESKYIIEYDKNKCIGAATCSVMAPLTFVMNEENKAQINVDSTELDTDENILEGAQSCPVLAIKVLDKQTGEVIFPIEWQNY